jgi:hypothetical protein
MDGDLHLPSGFGQMNHSACFDAYLQPSFGYPQPSCWYRLPAQSKTELLSSRISNSTDQTHVEDVKDPEKFLIPSKNLVLITLREDEPEDYAPFAPFINLPLHLAQRSAIDSHR